MKTASADTCSEEHEGIRNILASIRELNLRSSKHQQIRLNHWIRKLMEQPVRNKIWLKNVMEHATVLLQMLQRGLVEEPFLKLPPQGPLPMLPRHCVARFVGHRQARQRTPSKLSERRPPQHNQNIQRYVPNEKLDVELDNLFQMTSNSKLQVITESKQCQTTAEDAQWEWQQVWKGAFERLKRELQDKDSELQTMTIELKELRALVAAQKHALELQDRVHDDADTKNRAEIDNMRAVHALEIEDLKTKQKKQLQQMALQNEQILRQRRRDKEMDGPFNMQSDKYGDFLAYIDDFYSDTLRLTTKSA